MRLVSGAFALSSVVCRRRTRGVKCLAARPRILLYGRSFVPSTFTASARGPPTARAALDEAVARLREAGVPEAQASAEWLLAHVLGSTTRSAVAAAVAENARLSVLEAGRFRSFVARRLTREPVQYIVGKWAFHDLELEVRPPVLVPRPETEELVDLVLDWWRRTNEGPARFLDVGCGTGCVGLALLKALPPGSFCRAIDVSPDAVRLARHNGAPFADSYVVDKRSAFAPRPSGEARYDFIVSNPPYVPTADLASLDLEVRAFEDPVALDGGADGLHVARAVLDFAPTYLDAHSTRTVWFELDSSHPLTLAADLRKRRDEAASSLVPYSSSSVGHRTLPRLVTSYVDAFDNHRFAQLAFDDDHHCSGDKAGDSSFSSKMSKKK